VAMGSLNLNVQDTFRPRTTILFYGQQSMVGVTLVRKGVEALTEGFLEHKACIWAPSMERNTTVLWKPRVENKV
jgi:hypothetical protein